MGRLIFPSTFLTLLLSVPFASCSCPLYGPVFPIPTNLANSNVTQEALQTLTEAISTSFDAGNSSYGPVDSTAAYAIQVFSLDSETALWEYYHDGITLSNTTGVQKLDGDSIFRIGSISKLITVYLILTELGDSIWSDPVTKHIPELRNRTKSLGDSVNYVNWDQITMGALAGHVAGLPRDFIDLFGLYAIQDPTFGLPILSPSEYPACILTETNYTCDRAAFFDAINDSYPSFLPNTKATYSDTGIMLLGYAISSITGKPFEDILKTALIDPLGLTGTSFSKPEDTKGVIPFNITASEWARDFGAAAPMGGLYASTNDLSKIGRSILNSTLLDQNTTRAWLKPTAFTSSPLGFVGRPWEIFRAVDLGPSKRLIDLYTKSGEIGLYHTNLIVVPDYNIGFVTAVAGTGAHLFLDNLIVDTLFPAVEAVAREQAAAAYVGKFTAPKDLNLNSSVTFITDATLPGLGISEWVSNGTDFLAVLSSLGFGDITPDTLRLLPTNLERATGNGTEVAWRMSLSFETQSAKKGPFSACDSWFNVDLLTLGKFAIDEFIFTLSGDGDEKAVSVDLRAFKVVLEREG
ncbi:beta-lactamase/transpeptidase-like protein [Lindgomyces ingoldianus]|uniref:Beta-lactamase/transpeptidase-like protein n=1 Tax=Lindgomyces ingoldianus TaxID=673940 RepID=A0ACB6QDM8_9PLEO|nr:beta-lactamase/transpeptidase-like protein [Lindgomyces ingoldianus]KAF2465002.1 beta-lactamase/transpeptidase-like protein [Lindgomyces ingoldianus]